MQNNNYKLISNILERIANISPEKQKLLKLLIDNDKQQLSKINLKDLFYEIEWQPQPRQLKNTETFSDIFKFMEPGSWLIFADKGGVGEALAKQLQQIGQKSILVYATEVYQTSKNKTWNINPSHSADFKCLFQEVLETNALPLKGIIYLWSLEATSPEDLTIPSLAQAQILGCSSVLHLVQALVQHNQSVLPRLWFVTRGVAPVKDYPIAIAQSLVWGLSKVIALEHPELWGGVLDLGHEASEDDATILLTEIRDSQEDYIAFRDGQRYVARLVHNNSSQTPQIPLLEANNTYLITGGLGALGLKVAQWMVEQGAKNLVLTGRREASIQAKEILRRLENEGIKVKIAQADISNQEVMVRVFEEIQSSMPPVKGIVHAAGTTGYQALEEMEQNALESVLRPKVIGTWVLHQLSQKMQLDFFINFSSIASVWGSKKQAHYAAANHFLDSFAHYRRRLGLPALSVNWGPWADGGMASSKAQMWLSQMGVKVLLPQQALEALGLLLGANCIQTTVANIDWTLFKGLYESRRRRPLFDKIDAQLQEAVETVEQQAAETNTFRKSEFQVQDRILFQQILQSTPNRREEILISYLQEQTGKVLHMDAQQFSSHENLLKLGIDSLMIMEVINQIRKDLQITVYPREFYEQPTFFELAQYFAKELELVHGKYVEEFAAKSVSTQNNIQVYPSTTVTEVIIPISQKLPKIIFITSSPRSGSTLLRTMLAGHPALFSPPELHLLPFSDMVERCEALSDSFLEQGLQRSFMELMHLDADASQAFIDDLVRNEATTQDVYAKLQELANGRLLVDKSPTYAANRGTLERAEKLFDAPKYIHLTRHPYAVIESFVRMRMNKLLGASHSNPYYLAEEVWANSNQNMLDIKEKVGFNRYHLVRYEELVTEPKKVISRLCEFLNISFDETLLKPYEGNRMTDGIHSQSLGINDPNFLKHNKIAPDLAQVWKQIHLPQQLGGFAKYVAAELEYELPTQVQTETTKINLPKRVTEKMLTLQPVSRDGELPLSFAQARLWFLNQLEGESATYNVAVSVRLSGSLHVAALEQAIKEIVQRHEALRTTFLVVNGSPVQIIAPSQTVTVPIVNLQDLPQIDQSTEVQRLTIEEAQHFFDLSQGPLLRVTLLKLSEEKHTLLVTMHHIVCDGWSMRIFLQELSTLYTAFSEGLLSPLANLSIQYADFAHWQRQWLQGEVLETQLNYWKNQLAGAPPLLELPTDQPRPSVQSFRGSTEPYQFNPELTQKLKKLSQQLGVSLFMTLLTAFVTLLFRYSDQEDIVVGSPIANRNRAETEGLIGFFVNTLVLRTNLAGNPTFQELLARVRQISLDAYAHQDMPFEKLVEELQPERNLDHNPLFQIMFVLQNAHKEDLKLPDLTLNLLKTEKRTTPFDLTLSILENEQGIAGELEYSTDLFNSSTITRMWAHFQTLLEGIIANPSQRLSDLPLLTPKEQQQLLVEWNGTQAEYPQDICIHELFTQQVERTPDAIAIVFANEKLTYQELNTRADRLAQYLQRLGVGPEILVGIYLERSVEMVVAILATLKAGGAYLPLDPTYPCERLRDVLEDAQISVLLTQQQLASELPEHQIPLVNLDRDWSVIAQEGSEDFCRRVSSENLAYVIYTSGSTGRPKGVLITHQALVNYTLEVAKQFNLQTDDRVLQFASLGFDVVVEELFPALLSGATVVLPNNKQPISIAEFLRLIEQEKLTVFELPTAYWHQLVHELSHLQKGLPSYVRLVIIGGERVSPERLTAWQKFCLPLIHVYGLTETTVTSTLYYALGGAEQQEVWSKLPIGQPIANTQIYLLDSHQQLIPIGVPGEVYIGGVGLARGYLNRPETTAERFIPDPFSQTPGARLYKTGDQAIYLSDGNIEFLGRIDHQVKIRGFRIEPGEIEAALRQHPGVRETVTLLREESSENQRLVAYIVTHQGAFLTSSELRSFLLQKLPAHMVPTHFVIIDTFPLTPNGKVDRQALPAPDAYSLSLTTNFIAPRTLTEEVLAAIWAEILEVKVGIYDNFFELGGHSLLATQVISRVHETFLIELPLRCLFESPTVVELSQTIEVIRQGGSNLQIPAINTFPRNREMPLSFAQQGLWFLSQLEGKSSTYNIPAAWSLIGSLNLSALKMAVQEIVQRHEILRTNFKAVNGFPAQVIASSLNVVIPVVNLQSLLEEEQIAEMRRLAIEEAQLPFDLAQDTLLRVTLLRLSEESHVLLLTMHHIISDGWSTAIFIRELSALYEAFSKGAPSPLPTLPLQYADFTSWQRQWLSGEVLKAQLNYWQQQLAGTPLLLKLPTDRPRPPVQTFRGSRKLFELNRELTQKLKILSQQSGSTLYVTLLATFVTLLSRYSGQEDIVVGSPIANRNRRELEPLIGFFVNVLVLRTNLQGTPTFQEMLTRVQQVAFNAYVHQDVSFEQVVEVLQPERSLSYSPLFQVMFVLQNAPVENLELSSLTLTSLERVNVTTAKFDLTLSLEETQDGLIGIWEYNTDLFDTTTINRMVEHFQTLLEAIVTNPKQRVSELPLLTTAERHQLLMEWNDTQTYHPKILCIHELFEAQVKRTPDATAVIFNHKQLTYQQLNSRANQLAHYLQKLGVESETLVGICVERSLEIVVGLLGILKAGGAYVPLDPTYPKERLAYMLNDSQVPILLTQSKSLGRLPNHDASVICLDTDWETINRESEENPISGVQPTNLAYTLYTSGSTGRPKGVAIEHHSAIALLNWAQETFTTEQISGVLASTSICFDLSVFELFVPLSWGGKVILVENILHLPGLNDVEEITLINTVPSAMTELLKVDSVPASVKTVNLAGEPLQNSLVQQLYQQETLQRVFNLYGPSEGTTYSTFALMEKSTHKSPTIGRPIANTQAYILDHNLQLVPIGVPGELHIGGAGLARGYLNHPGLTAEKFIANPFNKQSGERLYKTGDLVRYLPDGNIEFLGRIDSQIKVRGFRIELGEIETILTHHPNVREAVVIAWDNQPGNKRLVVYIVPNEEQPIPNELRRFLQEKLPDYMVPSAFVVIKTMPLTPNGKVDRRALPAPELSSLSRTTSFVAPQTPTENLLTKLWAEVLGIEQVGIHDNFFDLGGHSLLLTQVHSKAQKIFDSDISIIDLFKYPTISALAQHISQEHDVEQSTSRQTNKHTRKQKEAINQQKELLKQKQRRKKPNG